MSKKKTTKRRRLKPIRLPVEQQIGNALLTQNLKLLRDLAVCNGSVTVLQKVWKVVGAAYDQAAGGDEFFDLDLNAYGPPENECDQPEYASVAEAINGIREASHLLYQSIDIYLRVIDRHPPGTINRWQIRSIAKRYHDFVEAALGYATQAR